MAEAQADYVIKALDAMDARGARGARAAPGGAGRLDRGRTAALAGHGLARRRLRQLVPRRSSGRNTTLWPDYAFRFAGALKTFDAASTTSRPAPERITSGISAPANFQPQSGPGRFLV